MLVLVYTCQNAKLLEITCRGSFDYSKHVQEGHYLFRQQWRSQNAEKVMHIKGRLLDKAVIL